MKKYVDVFYHISVIREIMKPSDAAHGVWPSYNHPPDSSASLSPSYDLNSSLSLVPSYAGVPGSIYHMMPSRQQPSSRIESGSTAARRPSLKSHGSSPSLKRSHQSYEQAQCSEITPELCNVVPDSESQKKPTMHPDHRLLSFGQTQARNTILNHYGRPVAIEITAQINGMFFLSEIAMNSGEAIVIQPELTCYRRNLFQISGSVATPTGPISVLTGHGQTVPIVSRELSISATESVDGHVIRLIVVPWKTPPPNSPEVPQNQEQEPPIIVLDTDTSENQEINNEVTIQTVAWRRLQFRVATANNGRRKELQQHFVLRLNLMARLADNTKLCIAEATTAPIVVRGRSPRNFQARKEIPFAASSPSPRGQSAQISPTDRKIVGLPQKCHAQDHLPKRSFQFDSSNLTPSPQLLRQNYKHWTASRRQLESAITSTTSSFTPPQEVSQMYVQNGLSDSDTMRLNAIPSSESQLPVAGGNTRTQFHQITSSPGSSLTSFQLMDTNPRLAKICRHAAASDLSNIPPCFQFEERHLRPYSVVVPTNDPSQQSRDYFPLTLEPETWNAAESGHLMYSTSTMPTSHQHFPFASQPLVKEDLLTGDSTWSAG